MYLLATHRFLNLQFLTVQSHHLATQILQLLLFTKFEKLMVLKYESKLSLRRSISCVDLVLQSASYFANNQNIPPCGLIAELECVYTR